MLNLNTIQIGTMRAEILANFYSKVLGKDADFADGDWCGWQAGACFLTVGPHSDTAGKSKNSARVMFCFETLNVKEEFERIKGVGATVIKEPYDMGGSWIATFADPDGNYFQLMSPWE